MADSSKITKEEFKKSIRYIWNYFLNDLPTFLLIITLIPSILAKVLNLFPIPPWVITILYIVYFGLSIWSIIAKSRKEAKVLKFQNELGDCNDNNKKLKTNLILSEQKLQNNLDLIIKGHLYDILHDLGLGPNCRISLYKYDYNSHEFVLIGRLSENPNLLRTGRGRYSESDGVIGKVWEQSVFYLRLPSASDDSQGWLNDTMKLGIDLETASLLDMKSCLFSGLAIKKYHRDKIGIIILESTDPNGFVAEKVIAKFKEKEEKFVELMEELIGDDYHYSLNIVKEDEAESKGY